MYQLKLFIFKPEFQTVTDLHTTFAAETHATEGEWLEEQLNVVRLVMFRVGITIIII
jgi:hypothetical protein